MQKHITQLKHMITGVLTSWYKGHMTESVDVLIRTKQLKKLFELADMKVLDVGARGGPLDSFRLLAPFADLFICEPDTEEIQKVEHELRQEGHWRNVTALPFALAAQPGTAMLHCAEKPGLSSLLEANRDEMKKFYSISGWSRIARDISVPTDTLDRAARQFGFQDLSVIKLDTQGTELDILKSGEMVLSSVLALYVEMEFIPLYKGQPLFHEVNAFLRERGFQLIDIKRSMHRRKSVHKPEYSKRELTWAHGLYFKTRHADEKELTPNEKIKLACIACAFEYFDYAVWLLEQKDVQSRLAELGLMGAEEDTVEFSRNFWAVLKKRLNWLRRREVLATVYSDRWHER